MRFFQSIRFKISSLASLSFAIVYIIVLIYSGIELKKQARYSAINDIKLISSQHSSTVKEYLEDYMSSNRVLCQIFEDYNNIDNDKRRSTFQNILIKVLDENPNILAAWTIWEPNALDSLDYLYINKPGNTQIGSFSSTYYKEGNEIVLENSLTDGELFIEDYYTIPKNSLNETIMDSHYYSYTGENQDQIIQTSTVTPIITNNIFKGVVGFDISLTKFKPIIDSIKLFETGYAILISSSGSIVAHPNKNMIGKNIFENNNVLYFNPKIKDKISNGKSFNFYNDNKRENVTNFIQITPFNIGKTNTPWAIITIIPNNEINKEAQTIIYTTALIGIVGLLLIIIIGWLVIGQITKPLSKISSLIKDLNNADLNQLNLISTKYKNEVGEIANSTYTLINWLNDTGKFANEIKEKNYTANYSLLNNNDILGESLIEMRDYLAKTDEEDKQRAIENKQQIWYSEGLGKIGEILRQNGGSVDNMSSATIKYIIDYIGANQGGIFTINDDDDTDIYYELSAAVAYSRDKIADKKVRVGEGLVGRCIFEKLPILLTEIPQNYIKITSGLGTLNPNCILIVPILLNNVVYGVIELASFNKFEKFQIEFVEKISDGIASAIANLKTTQNTTLLLKQSQSQSEMLASQEEEMRQNLEELQATQEEQQRLHEESTKNEENILSIIDSIPDSLITIDSDGIIKGCNSALCLLTNYNREEIEDKPLSTLFEKFSNKEIYKETTFTTSILKKDNSKLKISVRSVNIKNKNFKRQLLLIKEIDKSKKDI